MSTHRSERGGVTTLRTTSALHNSHDYPELALAQRSNQPQRNATVRRPQFDNSAQMSMTSFNAADGNDSSIADSPPTIPFPPAEVVAQSELLQDNVFPTWKDDAGMEGFETPEELQKKDPLGTQIWKLYSRTKTRLPNQERMENLTWRMMAMNLKRLEREQAMYDPSSPVSGFTNEIAAPPRRSRRSRFPPVQVA